MRENSGLWIALIVGGGLLLAGLAGLGGMAVLRQQSAQRQAAEKQKAAEEARAEAEAKLAAMQKEKKKAAPPGTAAEIPPEPPANPTATDRWAKADIREYAIKLHQDYQGNAVAADNKYKGKTVGVVGAVYKVDTAGGKPVVILKAGEFEFAEMVMCFCDNADRNKLATLAEGHWVALVGECSGKETLGGLSLGVGVSLKGCTVVHIARTEAEMNKSFQQKK